MYLAGILGLCALLHVPASGYVSSGPSFCAPGTVPSAAFNQEPAKPDSSPSTSQEPPKPETSPAAPQQPRPFDTVPPQTANPSADSPSVQSGSGEPSPSTPKKKKKTTKKKKSSSRTAGQQAQKKVVRRGSTDEPTTKLSSSITDEQAVRQRQNTNQLLVSTDASLQKLSGRQLTKDEQETVVQIRKFMEQVKIADAAGDLQRAYNLAVKAHLLSDALARP
jgi:hypothetical protein